MSLCLALSSLPHGLLPPCPPQIVLSSRHHWILVWIVLTDTSWDRVEDALPIEAPEEWNRIPFSAALIDDTVYRAYEEIVRLTHKTVRNVDDERSRDRFHLDPPAGFTEHF